MTASPLAKVWAIAFEGMLVTPLDWLALEDMKFCPEENVINGNKLKVINRLKR